MAEGTVERERTWVERIEQLERTLKRVERIAERQRDRVDMILGTEPEVRDEDMPQTRYAR